MATVLSGAAFGAAMLAAGFYDPAVVIAQLKFENWHMFQAFLAATASSVLYYNLAERFNYAKLTPRSSSPIGLFGTYDGNIVGGAMLGAGMALSGSCPGTLFAQMAAGVSTGFYALNGAILGGVVWTGYLRRAVELRREQKGVKPQVSTLDDWLGWSKPATLLFFQTAFAGLIALTMMYTPRYPGTKLSGAAGGLLIGLAQLLSIVTRRSMMGVSGAYEELGNLFWSQVPNKKSTSAATEQKQSVTLRNVMFACSAGVGALALSKAFPALTSSQAFEVPPVMATLGGILMVIGARLAGGCTSGHGISGISLLSTSSVITIASTFAVGSLVANSVY